MSKTCGAPCGSRAGESRSGLTGAVVVSLALFCLSALGEPPAVPEPEIESIFNGWRGTDRPGGLVAIIRDGQIQFQSANGMASLEYDVPITSETVFNTGSTGKQFTALAILMLAREGRLGLDDDIRSHIPEVPDLGTPITLRHLIHHTSGIRDFQSLLGMAGWRVGDEMNRADGLRIVGKMRELNFEPGEEFLYSNTGYFLLALVVERITGEPFVEWTRREIFQPLRMTRTEFREDLTRIYKNTATSYYGSPNSGLEKAQEWWSYVGSGNLYTTVGDLVRWLSQLQAPTPPWKELIAQLHAPGTLNNGKTADYAFGLIIDSYRALRLIHHGGNIGGYATFFGYFPDHDLGLVVLSNFSGSDPRALALKIADLLLADALAATESAAPKLPYADRPTVEVSSGILGAYTGWYAVQDKPGLVLAVGTDGDGEIYLRTADGDRHPLKAASDTVFFTPAGRAEIRFHPEPGGTTRHLTLTEGKEYAADRLGISPRSPDYLGQFAGEYSSAELDTRYILFVDEGKLMARHARRPDFEIEPTVPDHFTGPWFFAQLSAERDAGGAVTGLRATNPRVRNLLLSKIDR